MSKRCRCGVGLGHGAGAGPEAAFRYIVTDADTAPAVGSGGGAVLATRGCALAEQATVDGALEAGATTVESGSSWTTWLPARLRLTWRPPPCWSGKRVNGLPRMSRRVLR